MNLSRGLFIKLEPLSKHPAFKDVAASDAATIERTRFDLDRGRIFRRRDLRNYEPTVDSHVAIYQTALEIEKAIGELSEIDPRQGGAFQQRYDAALTYDDLAQRKARLDPLAADLKALQQAEIQKFRKARGAYLARRAALQNIARGMAIQDAMDLADLDQKTLTDLGQWLSQVTQGAATGQFDKDQVRLAMGMQPGDAAELTRLLRDVAKVRPDAAQALGLPGARFSEVLQAFEACMSSAQPGPAVRLNKQVQEAAGASRQATHGETP
jgi:hypothetical protein